jgi:ketosteroid isomerase-like protein
MTAPDFASRSIATVVTCTALALAPGTRSPSVSTAHLGGSFVRQPGPEPDVDLSNPDVRTIVQMERDYGRNYNAPSIDGLMTVYSPQIIYTAQGLPSQAGSDVVRGQFAKLFAVYGGRLDLRVAEVKVFGDVAYARASLTLQLTPKAGGEPSIISGRLLEILRKEDGHWRVTRVMTNSDRSSDGEQ